MDIATERRVRSLLDAAVHDWSYRWTGFPVNYCGSACAEFIPVLREKLPNLEIHKVIGHYRTSTYPEGIGHAWIETKYGVVIDPTLGQFEGGPPAAIVRPSDPCYANYFARRTPASSLVPA